MSHGFTTKPGAHGFGLHISANAPREMAGYLRADSAGEGMGPMFVLELTDGPP
jgi:C4-dicarboxylate-specific signal transduction histidine kinase